MRTADSLIFRTDRPDKCVQLTEYFSQPTKQLRTTGLIILITQAMSAHNRERNLTTDRISGYSRQNSVLLTDQLARVKE